jgi:peptide/nickel transport system substrate-binding protein
LNLGVRYELGDLASKVRSGITADGTKRLFNAAFAIIDGSGTARPYLAEALPQLNTETWRVFPDGRMETTYRLRPNLSWHDGQPLSAEDFLFALRAYNAGLGRFEPTPQDRFEDVAALDERTVVIRWRTLYPEAGALRSTHFDPLPRHLLQRDFEEDSGDSFINHSYWARDFVGTGPYRLERWEPGSHLDALAFAGHALGRPKIDRIIVRFFGDENTTLTNLLSENVHIAIDNSLRFEHASVLKREWGPGNRGVVLLDPVQPRFTNIQYRPEYANPRAVLDLRVRRALAHAVDKQAINDALFDGEIPLADQFLPRTVAYFADLDRAITKYPYDLRQTDGLMNEAAFRRGGDGIYASSAGERFGFEHWVIAGSQNEKQGAVMAEGWRRAGFEVKEHAIPTAQATDGQVRATFPALSSVATGGGEANLNFLTTSQIPSPGNRWTGNNRGGWVSPEYDRLWDQFNTTLDRSERNRQAIEMMRLATEDVAMMFLFHSANVTAHLSALRGPELGTPDTLTSWNLHEWELTR